VLRCRKATRRNVLRLRCKMQMQLTRTTCIRLTRRNRPSQERIVFCRQTRFQAHSRPPRLARERRPVGLTHIRRQVMVVDTARNLAYGVTQAGAASNLPTTTRVVMFGIRLQTWYPARCPNDTVARRLEGSEPDATRRGKNYQSHQFSVFHPVSWTGIFATASSKPPKPSSACCSHS
jgi:hypothetical protein